MAEPATISLINKMTRLTSKNDGFTLIELLVAMTIVAVLMGLSLVSYQGARKSARDGRRKTDLEEVRAALEMCRTDDGSYPALPLVSGDDIVCGTVTYMTIPDDPIPDQRYYYNMAADTYTLDAALEIDTGNDYGSLCGPVINCNYRLTNP